MNQRSVLQVIARVAAAACAATMLLSGCLGSGRAASARAPTKPGGVRVDVSPAELGVAVAKVVSVNSEHGFVVIDFGSQIMPAAGTQVAIFRGDKHVGTVRVTEPTRAPFGTADIVEGEAHVGDEAR